MAKQAKKTRLELNLTVDMPVPSKRGHIAGREVDLQDAADADAYYSNIAARLEKVIEDALRSWMQEAKGVATVDASYSAYKSKS